MASIYKRQKHSFGDLHQLENGKAAGAARGPTLRLHDDDNVSMASSSKMTLDSAPAVSSRKGTAFAAPKHGDELPEQRRAPTQNARHSRGNVVGSPYVPGRDTSRDSSRSSARIVKRKGVSPIPTASFYGQPDASRSVAGLASGAPSFKGRAGGSAVTQYRNGQANKAHLPRGQAVRVNRDQNKRGGAERIEDRGPIEISSDDGERDEEDDDFERQPSTANGPHTTPKSTALSDAQTRQQQTSVKGKEAVVEIRQKPNSNVATREEDEGWRISTRSMSRSPVNDMKQASGSPTQDRSSGSRATSRQQSPEHMRLNPARKFTIATEEDARAVEEQATAADRGRPRSIVDRMRPKGGGAKQPQNAVSTGKSLFATSFASTMDNFTGSVRSRLGKEKANGKARETETSDEEEAEDCFDVPVGVIYFSNLARVEEGAHPRIARLRPESLTLQWTDDGRLQDLTIAQKDLQRVVFVDNKGRCTVCIEPDSSTAKHLVEHFKHKVDDGVLQRYEKDPAIYIEAPANGDLSRAWQHFVKHVRVYSPDLIDLSADAALFCTSHLDTRREKTRFVIGAPATALTPAAAIPASRAQAQSSVTAGKPGQGQAAAGDAKKSLPPSVSAAPEEDPVLRFGQDDSNTRVVFPRLGEHAVSLKGSDLYRLQDGEFLNDTMIEFGLRYLLEYIRERDPKLYDEIYIFSSFFYRRFTADKKDRERSFDNVKKWTRHVDIFKKKYLVMPINESFHWYLVIITNPFQGLPMEDQQTVASTGDAVQAAPGDTEMLPPSRTTSMDRTASEGFVTPPGFQSHDQDRVDPVPISVPVTDKRSAIPGDSALPADGDEAGKRQGQGDDDTKNKADTSAEDMLDEDVEFNGEKSSNKKPRISIDVDGDDNRFPGNGRLLRSRGPAFDVPLSATQPTRRVQTEETRAKQHSWLQDLSVVLVFDSLGKRHGATVRKYLHEYLCREYRDKRGGEVDKESFALKDIDVAMPQQNNCYDCGFYVLYAFERFFQEPERFMTDVIPSRNAKHECWNASDALTRRKWWRKELGRLADEHAERKKERKQEKQRESPSKTADDIEMQPVEAEAEELKVDELNNEVHASKEKVDWATALLPLSDANAAKSTPSPTKEEGKAPAITSAMFPFKTDAAEQVEGLSIDDGSLFEEKHDAGLEEKPEPVQQQSLDRTSFDPSV